MKGFIQLFFAASACVLAACSTTQVEETPAQLAERWTEQKANDWYQSVKWPVGANFAPSTAINQLEMWQEDAA